MYQRVNELKMDPISGDLYSTRDLFGNSDAASSLSFAERVPLLQQEDETPPQEENDENEQEPEMDQNENEKEVSEEYMNVLKIRLFRPVVAP